MKKLLLTLAIVCLAGVAFAQIDPDPDGIGMYFDMDGDSYCLDGATGPVSLYLVITNPSEPSGVSGWEAHVDYVIPGGCFEQSWTLLGSGALNVSVAPDFIVGLNVPFPWAPSIAVASYGLLVFCTDCIPFFVRAADNPSIPGTAIYAAGDDPGIFIPLQQSSGGPTYPVAQINCGCTVIPTEDATWGNLKAMYK